MTVFGNENKPGYSLDFDQNAKMLSAFAKVAAENGHTIKILDGEKYPLDSSEYFDLNSWSGDVTLKPEMVDLVQSIASKMMLT